MPKKLHKPKWKKPSSNPLNNLNLSAFLEDKEKEKIKKEDTYRKLQKEYETMLSKRVKREHRAYRIKFKNHPDLLYIGFGSYRGTVIWQAVSYFHDCFHPFFSTDEDCRREMGNARAYRVQELDKHGLSGFVPIPDLLRVLDVSMACSVCKKGKFKYSDYLDNNCYIIEGEGNLNPFTKGYILCHDCYKKYIKNR